MSSLLPVEKLIDLLDDSIQEFKEASIIHGEESDEVEKATHKVGFMSHLLLMNLISEGNIDGAIKTMDKMEEVEKASKFFQTPKN